MCSNMFDAGWKLRVSTDHALAVHCTKSAPVEEYKRGSESRHECKTKRTLEDAKRDSTQERLKVNRKTGQNGFDRVL